MLTGGVSVWMRGSMRERGDSPLKGTGLFIFLRPPLHDCRLSSEEKEKDRVLCPFKTPTAVPRQLCLYRGHLSVQCT